MRQLTLVVVLAALFAVTGSAANCIPGTLTSYIALGSEGCNLGGLSVFDFNYKAQASGGAPEITPDQINVTPLLAPVAFVGLQFTAPWSVASGQQQGSHVTYKVVSPTAGRAIQQLTLDGTGFQAGPFGGVVVNEVAADQGQSYDLKVFIQCTEVCRSQTTATVAITPTPALVVSDTVLLNSRMGTSTLSNFVSWFSECPACV